jgi:hypothetical protein
MANSNFKVKNGLEVTEKLYVYDTTNASTSASAAVVLSGGMGVAQDIIVDGDVIVNGISVRSISASGTILSDWYVVSTSGDNTTSIQNKLNEARDNGGGTVYIPSGTFTTTATLKIYSNTRLLISEAATLTRGHTATFFIANGDAAASYSGYGGQSNISIEGGVWDMNATNASYQSNSLTCMGFAHGSNINIKNLIIKNVQGDNAISLNGIENCNISNVKFIGYYSVSSSTSEAIKIDVMKDSAAFNYFGSYDNTPCKNINIESCYFGASGSAGTTAWHRGIGSRNSVSSVFHTAIRVSNNFFDTLLGNALDAKAYRDFSFTNNTVRACRAGIIVGVGSPQVASNQINIDNNTFSNISNTTNNQDATIYIKGESSFEIRNVSITNNTIFNGGGAGTSSVVQVDYTLNSNISSNSIDTSNCSATNSGAIQINNSNQLNVSNNVIASITNGGGIVMLSSNDINTSSNKIDSVGKTAIYLGTTQRSAVVNNIMKDASQSLNNTEYYIRLVNADNILISGNYARSVSATKVQNALRIDNASDLTTLWGNDFLGTSVGATINNAGTNSKTTVDNR